MANRSIKLKNGRLLDDKLIQKLSREAERGYDLSKLRRRVILRPGRPARGEPMGESPRVASRVPDGVLRGARERADREGLSVSEVIRSLLTDYAAGGHPVGATRRKATASATARPSSRRPARRSA